MLMQQQLQQHQMQNPKQQNNNFDGREREDDAGTPKEVDSDEEDAFDRLIKKTYDRDCEKFFQRIDKLKSGGSMSQRSKSSVSNKTNTFVQKRNRPLSSLSGGHHIMNGTKAHLDDGRHAIKVAGQPATAHMRLKSSNNLHSHCFSQLQLPSSSQNVRNCNSKLIKPLLQLASSNSLKNLQKRQNVAANQGQDAAKPFVNSHNHQTQTTSKRIDAGNNCTGDVVDDVETINTLQTLTIPYAQQEPPSSSCGNFSNNHGGNQPFTQISAIYDGGERQKAYCNEGLILLTDETALHSSKVDLTNTGGDESCSVSGIGDKSTCKNHRGMAHSEQDSKVPRIVNYSEQETERRRDHQQRLISKLQNDVKLLKEIVRDEKIDNQKLRTQLDKLRLQREIESPTYKLHQLRFKMERERVGLEESKAKLEKDLFRLKEELGETKLFYEERIAQMDQTIKKLQQQQQSNINEVSANKNNGAKRFGAYPKIVGGQRNNNGNLGDGIASNGAVDHTVESLNGSSCFLNGTSLEDIKEMTLNMKVPFSQNMKTKTEAESNQQNNIAGVPANLPDSQKSFEHILSHPNYNQLGSQEKHNDNQNENGIKIVQSVLKNKSNNQRSKFYLSKQQKNFTSNDGIQITAITQEAEEQEKESNSHHFIDEIDADADLDDNESNYITNGSYAQGIPSRNRGILGKQLKAQDSSHIVIDQQQEQEQSQAPHHQAGKQIVIHQGQGQGTKILLQQNNESLISQSMQLSDDDDEEVVNNAGIVHETSISYLTKDNNNNNNNNVQQQNSNRKQFNSNFTRKTTNQSNGKTVEKSLQLQQQQQQQQPKSQLDQFNMASGRLQQNINQVSLRKGPMQQLQHAKFMQTEQNKDFSSLDIDAQDSQILEESGVGANKINFTSFNMQQQQTTMTQQSQVSSLQHQQSSQQVDQQIKSNSNTLQVPSSIISQLHKKQQSAPVLRFSNTGSVQHNQTSPEQQQHQDELMSNFEDKLNGLLRQIDQYLDVQKDQSILTSERSSNQFQLLSAAKQQQQHKQLINSGSSLKQMQHTFGHGHQRQPSSSLSSRMMILRHGGSNSLSALTDRSIDDFSNENRGSLSHRMLHQQRQPNNNINDQATKAANQTTDTEPFQIITEVQNNQPLQHQMTQQHQMQANAQYSRSSIGGFSQNTFGNNMNYKDGNTGGLDSSRASKVEVLNDSLCKMQQKLNQLWAFSTSGLSLQSQNNQNQQKQSQVMVQQFNNSAPSKKQEL